MMRTFSATCACAIFFTGITLFAISPVHAQTAQDGTVIQLTVLNTYTISILKSGTGSGTVTSSDGNIVCGSICSENNILNTGSITLTATADQNSTFRGWSVQGAPAACLGTGPCVASSTEVITANFNLNASPSLPSSGIIDSPSGPPQFLFENFSSWDGTSSAVIGWYTTIPSAANISWGTNSDGTSGSGSETTYTNTHSIELDSLIPNTAYILTVQAVSAGGKMIYTTYSFKTLPFVNVNAVPLNASNFNGQVSFGGNILLSWNNPFEPDFNSVIVTRGTRFFPRDPNEGYIVYQGSEEKALDTNAVPGQEYYYSIFVKNDEGVYSSGTLLQYGLPSATGAAATSTPVFGGGVNSTGTSTEIGTNINSAIGSEIFSKINFIQNNELIPEINFTISIQGNLPTLLEIPSQVVPDNTEETIITIGQGTVGRQNFMFKKMPDGSLQALIPAILPTGSNSFTIDFLQVGSEVRLNGSLVVMGKPLPLVQQTIFSYFVQTYISNNFLSTTVPVLVMIFEICAALGIVVGLVKILIKK